MTHACIGKPRALRINEDICLRVIIPKQKQKTEKSKRRHKRAIAAKKKREAEKLTGNSKEAKRLRLRARLIKHKRLGRPKKVTKSKYRAMVITD